MSSTFSEFGDFQTPELLARGVVATLPVTRWGRVLEPTCGKGVFLAAVKELAPAESIGIEIQPEYASIARRHSPVVLNADIWTVDLATDLAWASSGPLLVVGNPPWVTSAALGRRGSLNLPTKSNPKALKGLEALTGAANVDVAERVWLKALVELQDQRPTVAMLCKTQVARNVLLYCHDFGVPVENATMRRVDARKWFGAAVDACLLTVVVGGAGSPGSYRCEVFESLDATVPTTTIAVRDGRLVSDERAYDLAAGADGVCPVQWRQGVKHDAAAVMELRLSGEDPTPRARDGAPVPVEDSHLYPLVKSTDLFRGRTAAPRRVMVVPQTYLNQDTSELEVTAPLLWEYLNRHGSVLDGRRSSVYRGRPRFSVFGIGAYSFAPYKVAVSGLHKQVVFRALGPVGGKPVVVDDTCYFLSVDTAEQAAFTLALLDSEPCQALLRSVVFADSKRPVTKKLLQRIDLVALAGLTEADRLSAAAAEHHRALVGHCRAEPVRWNTVQADLTELWRPNEAVAASGDSLHSAFDGHSKSANAT